jgi:hypothetical protein
METILKGIGQLGVALLPSAYAMLFLYRRYCSPLLTSPFPEKEMWGVGPYLFDLGAFVAFGILVYYLHRGVLHRAIWWLQRTVYGVPQFEFHQEVCKRLGIEGRVKNEISLSQACLFLTQAEERRPYRVATEGFNTGSHVLYISFLMFLVFFLHDMAVWISPWGWWRMIHPPSGSSRTVFGLLSLLFLAVALAYDRLADYREIAFLTSRMESYARIVAQLHRNWAAIYTTESVPWRRGMRRLTRR